MNGFDVHALGWIVTVDTFAEVLRVAFRGRCKTSPAALAALGERWRAVLSSIRSDRSSRLYLSLIVPLAMPLSKDSQTAVVEFVDRLEACYPDRYSEQVLRSRCLSGCAKFVTSAATAAILATFASSAVPMVGDVALVLFVIAGWNLVMTNQLWRTHRLMKTINRTTASAQLADGRVSRP
jgi:hypothetical protein